MVLSRKSLAGPGYIILNIIRVMNIIGFLAVIAASVVMLVKTSTTTNLFFFDAVGHVITAISSMFFIVSELTLLPRYFERCWPLLSPHHGFVTLGIAMIVIGITVMGNLNKDAGSIDHLGLPLWRIVISSGILIFILGHINLIATFVFRDRASNLTARMVRADGAANHKTPIVSSSSVTSTSPPHISAPVLAQTYISNPMTPPTGRRHSAFKIFTGASRDSILPSYQTTSGSPPSKEANLMVRSVNDSPTSKYSRATDCTKKTMWGNFMSRNSRMSLAPPLPINSTYGSRGAQAQGAGSPEISGPMNVNPQFAHLVNQPQRPDSALHPSRTGESNPYRWRGRDSQI